MSRHIAIKFIVFGAILAICTGCKGFSKDPLSSISNANSPKYVIGVENASGIQEAIETQLPKAKIKTYPDLITAYFALQVGDIDALAYNEIILAHTFSDSMSGLIVIDNDVGTSEEIVIGMNKHSTIPDLKGIINRLIDSLNAAGTLNELHEHWHKNLKTNSLISTKESDSEHVLRIATSADVPPFSFTSENQIIGIDTDIAKLLAEKLQRPLYEADAEIEKAAGRTIPEIFAAEGEEGFRQRETAVLRELGKRSGAVISTGGGCVTRAENYPLLHQNGTIIWLKRDLDKLARAGRPLSLGADLSAMYAVREPLYARFADFTVENSGTPAETVDAVLEVLR
jgi:shikimate kinase